MRIGALRRDDRQRILQREIQHGFGRQLDLLTFGRRLHTAAQSASGCGANACTLAAAGNATDDGADGCAGTDFFSGVLAA